MTKMHHIQARIICTKIWLITISIDMISVFITAKNTLTHQHQILVPLIELEFCQNVQPKLSPSKLGQETFFLPSWHSQCWCTSPPAPSVRWNFAPTNPELWKLLELTQGWTKPLGKSAFSETLFKVYASYGKWVPCETDFIYNVSGFPVISINSGASQSVCWEIANIPCSISLSPKI